MEPLFFRHFYYLYDSSIAILLGVYCISGIRNTVIKMNGTKSVCVNVYFALCTRKKEATKT